MNVALRKFAHMTFLAAGHFLVACQTSSSYVPLQIDPQHPIPAPVLSIEEESNALEHYVQKNSQDASMLADIRLELRASVMEQKKDYKAAEGSLLEAVKLSQGPFSEKIRHHLVRIQAKLNEGSKPNDSNNQSELLTIPPPKKPGADPQDPLMVRLAAAVCKARQNYGPGWKEWRRTLTRDVDRYFEALVIQCSGQLAMPPSKAYEIFSDVAPRLSLANHTVGLALEAYSRMIKYRRDQGERESVAPLFKTYVQLWRHQTISEKTLGMTHDAFEQRRIDDTLSAVRTLASAGDESTTKEFATEVINHVSSLLSQSFGLTNEQKVFLVSAAAECQHLLAFRLAVETRDWDRAIQVTNAALARDDLPTSWRIRLTWSLGLYHFLDRDYDEARRLWEQLLVDAPEDNSRSAFLYWIAEAHEKLGNASEAAFFRRSLVEDYPVNFYSLVALHLRKNANQSDAKSEILAEQFKSVDTLAKQLNRWQDQDLTDFRQDPNLGPRLHRAEILIALNLQSYSKIALDDLNRELSRVRSSIRKQEWILYMTRLCAAIGNWTCSTTLTAKLANDPSFWRQHPEQLLVFYPRPYLKIFHDEAANMGLSTATLMGLSRQESSFQADARSGANAWGVMQLTPSTAKRLVSRANLQTSLVKIPESLTVPAINIKMGALLVRELSSHFGPAPASIFAAYNAGSSTVDRWLARRVVEDPILFVELMPYQETRDYVKAVWRNQSVYEILNQGE